MNLEHRLSILNISTGNSIGGQPEPISKLRLLIFQIVWPKCKWAREIRFLIERLLKIRPHFNISQAYCGRNTGDIERS